jgi:hypothetical protein
MLLTGAYSISGLASVNPGDRTMTLVQG